MQISGFTNLRAALRILFSLLSHIQFAIVAAVIPPFNMTVQLKMISWGY